MKTKQQRYQEQQQRIKCANTELMYIYTISKQKCTHNNNKWIFKITNSNHNIFNILISNNQLKCSCYDFKRCRYFCKHIYFIIQKFLRRIDLLKHIPIKRKIFFNLFKYEPNLSNIIINKLKEDIYDTDHNNHNNHNNHCVICINTDRNQKINKCIQCNNIFHYDCIHSWHKKKKECPTCRYPWNCYNIFEYSTF